MKINRYANQVLGVVVLAGIALLSFIATAAAAATAAGSPDDSTLIQLLQPVYDAIVHGHAMLAAALLLVALVVLAKRYVVPRVPFLQSAAGTSLLIMAGAFGGALATALASSAMSWSVLRNAGAIAAAAAGGWMLVKTLLIDPVLRPLAAKAPAWAQPIFNVVFWFFDKVDPIKTAEKAGADAVAKDPGKGIAGVTGDPKDFQ